MYKTIFTSILSFCTIWAAAQTPTGQAPCDKPAYKQFDYWQGDWVVVDTTGKQVGTNKIVSMHNGCLLQENWVSSGTNTGTSYNYYVASDSTWNQLWIDNGGSVLKLKGGLVNGNMTLKSDLIPGTRIPFYCNRITWFKNADGTVTQVWEILDQQDNVLRELFRGIYKPK